LLQSQIEQFYTPQTEWKTYSCLISQLTRNVTQKLWQEDILTSFPGLLRLQFLIACSMQKWREKAWGIS